MRMNKIAAAMAVALTAATALAATPADAQRRHGGHHHGYHHRGGGGAFIGGLAAGAILGGALAAQRPYYAEPGYVYGGDAVAYCMSRFKSYDPASGTYLGYDGHRHPCP